MVIPKGRVIQPSRNTGEENLICTQEKVTLGATGIPILHPLQGSKVSVELCELEKDYGKHVGDPIDRGARCHV